MIRFLFRVPVWYNKPCYGLLSFQFGYEILIIKCDRFVHDYLALLFTDVDALEPFLPIEN